MGPRCVLDARRVMSLVSAGVLVLLLAACVANPTPAVNPGAAGRATPSAAPTGMSKGCLEPAVTGRLQMLLDDVSTGRAQAAAAHFRAGPDLRWEVYEHFDPPNGTAGALRTHDAIVQFVDAQVVPETWTLMSVQPPTGGAGLPEKGVYGLALNISAAETSRSAGAKVVIDCGTGLISHMVGPNAA